MRSVRLFLLFSAFVAAAYFLVFRTPSPSRAQSQSSGGGGGGRLLQRASPTRG